MEGMMTGLLLLLLAGVTVGRVVDLQKRIYGGQTCDKTDRLYHVRLIDDKTKKFVCGGSLIDKRWVLTAAHCVPKGSAVAALLNWHPDKTQAKEVQAIPFQRIDDQQRPHDIMLLKLEDHQVNVKTIDLPLCGKPLQTGQEVQIAGHGDPAVEPGTKKKMNLVPADTLQCGKTNIVPCTTNDWVLNKILCKRDHEELICYQSPTVDATGGDSGGGVAFNGRIYGVHSAMKERACSGTAQAMDVCKYAGWITEVTNLKFQ